MSKLIEMPSTHGTIIVEVETGDEIVPVNRADDRVIQQVDRAFNTKDEIIRRYILCVKR
jgi:hypothetical protein